MKILCVIGFIVGISVIVGIWTALDGVIMGLHADNVLHVNLMENIKIANLLIYIAAIMTYNLFVGKNNDNHPS